MNEHEHQSATVERQGGFKRLSDLMLTVMSRQRVRPFNVCDVRGCDACNAEDMTRRDHEKSMVRLLSRSFRTRILDSLRTDMLMVARAEQNSEIRACKADFWLTWLAGAMAALRNELEPAGIERAESGCAVAGEAATQAGTPFAP